MSVTENESELQSEDTNWNDIDFTFEDVGLSDDLLSGIYANGMNKMTPVQFRSLMASKTKFDFILRTSNVYETRVTLSMVILSLTEAKTEQCQSLVLVPSHDTALEMAKHLLSFGEYMSMKCSVCSASTNIAEDLREIRDGVHSIIGTPGRIYDLLSISAFNSNLVNTLVIIDVDDVFSCGYKECVMRILKIINSTKLLMSTNLLSDIIDALKLFPKIPIEIIDRPSALCSTVKQISAGFSEDSDTDDASSSYKIKASHSPAEVLTSSKRTTLNGAKDIRVKEFTPVSKSEFKFAIPLQPKHLTTHILARLVHGSVKTDINKYRMFVECCSQQRPENVLAIIGALKIMKGVHFIISQRSKNERQQNQSINGSKVVSVIPDCRLADRSSFLNDNWLKRVTFVDLLVDSKYE